MTTINNMSFTQLLNLNILDTLLVTEIGTQSTLEFLTSDDGGPLTTRLLITANGMVSPTLYGPTMINFDIGDGDISTAALGDASIYKGTGASTTPITFTLSPEQYLKSTSDSGSLPNTTIPWFFRVYNGGYNTALDTTPLIEIQPPTVSITSVRDNSTFAQYTTTGGVDHNLRVGSLINVENVDVAYNGRNRVTEVNSESVFTTDIAFDANQDPGGASFTQGVIYMDGTAGANSLKMSISLRQFNGADIVYDGENFFIEGEVISGTAIPLVV